MHIHNIKITNFKSLYGTHQFDFDSLGGLVKLSGPIGAGKTAIGEAILCALFGRVKDMTNNNMIAWGMDSYELEISLTSKGHDIIVVRNPKKQLSVYIDGKLMTATGKNDMQTVLEEYYDVPRMAIEKMCVISFNAFNSLAAMTSFETKRFLDDIFGFRVFTDYNAEVVIERCQQQTLQTELNALMTDTEKQIEQLTLKKAARQAELSQSIDIDSMNRQRTELIESGKLKKAELETAQTQLDVLMSDYAAKIKSLESQRTEAATLGKVQKDNYNKFKDGHCPTCGHTINASQIEAYRQKMESYAADWHHYDNDIKKLQMKRDNECASHNAVINDIQNVINDLRHQISSIDSSIRAYNDSCRIISENYDDLIDSYVKKKHDIASQLVVCDKEIGEWNEMNDLFTKTLRYRLLDTLIPHINNSIQHYMNKLEQNYKIMFDQEFKAHIYVDNIDKEISYNNLSTGQRKTVDIAIIFGILQNIIANVDFNIMFLDELMSNLDANSRNTMIDMLVDTVADGKTVFIINHAEMSDDFFNHKIRVALKNCNISKKEFKTKRVTKNDNDDEMLVRMSVYDICHFQ